MASQDERNAFEAMIHADRQRKKNEDLANQIFGRAKAKQSADKKQKERTPSLASRMGVQKRASSSTTPTQKNPFNPPSRPSSTTPSHRNNQSSTRASRIASEIDSGNSPNISLSSPRNNSFRNGAASTGFTIKGSAGPFTLLASNFAPGTTVADIEAALHTELFDEAGNNCLQSCQILSSRPSVVAEMVFSEKSVADRIVSKFNNLKADGRILQVTLSKSGPEALTSSRRTAGDRGRDSNPVAQTVEPVTSVSDNIAGPVGMTGEGDMEMDDVEAPADYLATSAYDHDREAADRDRRDRDRNRDGSGSGRRDDERRDSERPRDERDRRRDDRDRERERDRDRDRDRDHDRDREREGERDKDRERERERDYNRDYELRESYDNRQQRPAQPPYSNGFNGQYPRGGYGGYGGRGGYGYGRGGYGPRGSYRGGYVR